MWKTSRGALFSSSPVLSKRRVCKDAEGRKKY